MLKVIGFDFGGVLGPDANDWSETFKSIKKITKLDDCNLDKIFVKHWPKLKINEEPIMNLWNEISKQSTNKVNPRYLKGVYNKEIFIRDDMLKIVKLLKKQYRLVLIANDTDDDYKIKINKLNLNTYFEKIYCSSQLKIAKPNKEIFLYVLNDININPSELLFIDNQKNNIEAAEKLGIKTIHFKNHADFKNKLKMFVPNYTHTVTHV